MKYVDKQALNSRGLADEHTRAVLKAIEGITLSQIQEKSRDSSTNKHSKSKLNGLYREAFLKALSAREVNIA